MLLQIKMFDVASHQSLNIFIKFPTLIFKINFMRMFENRINKNPLQIKNKKKPNLLSHVYGHVNGY